MSLIKADQPIADRIEQVALVCLLLITPLIATTGFSQYNVIKGIVLFVLATFLLSAWTCRLCQGKRSWEQGAVPVLFLSGLFILYSACSLLWSPGTHDGWNRIALWIAFFAVFANVTQQGRAGAALLCITITSGIVALAVLLNRFGFHLPLDIPTGMVPDAGPLGIFDHAHYSANYLAITAPVGIFCLGSKSYPSFRYSRAVLIGIIILSFLALGVAGGPALIVSLISLPLGLILGIKSMLGHRDSMSIWSFSIIAMLGMIVGNFLLGWGTPDEDSEIMEFIPPSLLERVGIEGWENAVTTTEEWSFEYERFQTLWSESRWFGHGAGSWAHLNDHGLNADHGYYVRRSERHFSHSLAPGVLIGIPLELGALGGLLFLSILGILFMSLLSGISGNEEEDTSDREGGVGLLYTAVISTILILGFTSSAYHAAEGMAGMVVMGLAFVIIPRPGASFSMRQIKAPQGSFRKVERWLLIGLPIFALLIPSGWAFGKSVLADFYRQRGLVYFAETGYRDEAISELQTAASICPEDPLSLYHLGLAEYYYVSGSPLSSNSLDERAEALVEDEEAVEMTSIERSMAVTSSQEAEILAIREDTELHRERSYEAINTALSLRPYDLRMKLFSVLHMLRLPDNNETDTMTTMIRNRVNDLEQLLTRDPRNPEIYWGLSEAYRRTELNYDRSARTLLELISMTQDPEVITATYTRLGDTYSSRRMLQPEEALRYYQLALDNMPQRWLRASYLRGRMMAVEGWLESGMQATSD